MKPFFRKLHRWLGLLMAIQIIAWMGSGLYFAIFPIESIRGEHLTSAPAGLSATDFGDLIGPAVAWSSASEFLGETPVSGEMRLVSSQGQSWYRISGIRDGQKFVRLINANTGQLMPFLDVHGVTRIAEERLAVSGEIRNVELLETAQAGSEYRGRQLPLWRVSYSEPENLNLYVDGWTGEIVARRTSRWRVFDFLWMLHIMDFDERDDFNTPLLQIAAALGLLVALSGLIFWAMTTRLFRAGKKRPV